VTIALTVELDIDLLSSVARCTTKLPTYREQ